MFILLLDADPSRRSRLVSALTARSPHVIVEAGDADAAVAEANRVEHIDALIVAAPAEGPSGAGLLRSLRVRFKALRGASLVGDGLNGIAEGFDIGFSEPFDGAEILHWVQRGAESPSGTKIPDVLGDYSLKRLLVESKDILTFEAVQKSVDRKVLFQLLRPELAGEPEQVERFQGRLRAKAALIHPSVAPIYERGEEPPFHFYTAELLQGTSLLELAREGKSLTDGQVMNILKTTADVMGVMEEGAMHRRHLTAGDIYVDTDADANLANLAVSVTQADPDPSDRDILTLLNNLAALTPKGKAADFLAELSSDRPETWDGLKSIVAASDIGGITSVRSMRAPAASLGFFKTTAGRSAAGAVLGLGLLGLLVAWMVGQSGRPEERDLSGTVRIGQGSSLAPDGSTVRLDTFWIDEHEVTIGQYARFLEALAQTAKDGGDVSQFDHIDQPADKVGHQPEGWEALYEAAVAGNSFGGQVIDLNCPIFLVDWWDASAYANWRGCRLPTVEEWCKAARGREGNIYPWGNASSLDSANMGSDYVPSGPGGGGNDGFNLWAPVDHFASDLSAYGVAGMAGNVEEWTNSWVAHAEYPDRTVPAVMGGSFATPEKIEIWRPRSTAGQSESSSARGFRTVADTDPELAGLTGGE